MASSFMSRLTRRWKKNSVDITEEDPTFKTVYLGNTVTQWAKGSGSVDKPLATLWRNYCQSTKPDIEMRVTIAVSGLKATTREHGLTEYWSHRVTYAYAHPNYPKLFCWVYRHEGRKMKPELRCHAVLCSSETKARLMQRLLTEKLHQAFVEFRKEKQLRQNARLSVVSVLYPSTPARKVALASGGANYRPPLERSKSAPKLSSIEEDRDGEESEAREEERRRAANQSAMPPRPRALSEPLVPPPSVCSHPQAGAGSGADSDTESDTGSERSGASVPSDPTADSDCETTDTVLLQSNGPCRVYHVRRGSPVERRLNDCRLQVRCRLDDEAMHHQWTRASHDDIDDSASDESGYAEEVTRAA
ncbi:protein FAM43A-like [Amphibalanus amphitrite]|uniref:protein FAM43A-like n=1 Tax=Amphibalanus amphitrite TaxID=1232801 RepID=UPI001C91FA10|nr:protein FAM43A-like [Amphibalanus amphitrite]